MFLILPFTFLLCSQDNVPSWEKEFCASIGCVPWRKLVFTRKCMFGHEGVLNWDDSAGEEAFRNAKDQFWANINGLSCQISLPDPDIYIEKVNWNPQIDAELIKEVDRAYFNPAVNDEATELKDYESSHDNPCKRKNTECGEDLKWETWGTLRGATSTNELVDNPWDRGFTHGSQQMNWQQWRNSGVNNSQSDINPWEQAKNNQLGDPEAYSWGWNSGMSKNVYTNYAGQGERDHVQERRFPDEGRWRYQPKDGRNWNDGCRKRGNFHRGDSGYKSSRYRRDDYQTGHHRSRGRANKGISFAGSRY